MSSTDSPVSGGQPAGPLWAEVRVYGALTVFAVVAGLVYGVWSGEAAGTVLLLLTGVLAAITGGYLAFQERLRRTQARAAPAGEGAEGENVVEEEPFLPHASIWPVEVGVGMTLTLSGFALGWAVLVPGLLVTIHGLWGWGRQSRYRLPH